MGLLGKSSRYVLIVRSTSCRSFHTPWISKSEDNSFDRCARIAEESERLFLEDEEWESDAR